MIWLTQGAISDRAVAILDSRDTVIPYKVPEILAFKVHDGSRTYLDWIHGNVQVTERG